jgi:hypothetical protein
VDGALEHFASGTTLYGADARFSARLMPRLAGALRVGLRSGSVATAPDGDGQVQPSAWLAGVGLFFTMTPPESRWGLDAAGRFDVEHVTFVPTPANGAHGTSASYLALVAGLGLQGWFRVLPTLLAGAQVFALLPVRPVDAADANADFTGVSGAGIAAQLGLMSAL